MPCRPRPSLRSCGTAMHAQNDGGWHQQTGWTPASYPLHACCMGTCTSVTRGVRVLFLEGRRGTGCHCCWGSRDWWGPSSALLPELRAPLPEALQPALWPVRAAGGRGCAALRACGPQRALPQVGASGRGSSRVCGWMGWGGGGLEQSAVAEKCCGSDSPAALYCTAH